MTGDDLTSSTHTDGFWRLMMPANDPPYPSNITQTKLTDCIDIRNQRTTAKFSHLIRLNGHRSYFAIKILKC